jgi:hypothetical protein
MFVCVCADNVSETPLLYDLGNARTTSLEIRGVHRDDIARVGLSLVPTGAYISSSS